MQFDKKVILISDNTLIIKILGRALQKLNYNFFSVNSHNDISNNLLPEQAAVIIIDTTEIYVSLNELKSKIKKIRNKFPFTVIVSLFLEHNLEDFSYSLADDFHNLKEVLTLAEKELSRKKSVKKVPEQLNEKVQTESISQTAVGTTIENKKNAVKEKIKTAATVLEQDNSSLETHILLADDSKPVRNFVTKILSTRGYIVNTFVNGRVLIDYLSEGGKGDIILLDNQMPVLDGMDTLQILKGDEKWKDIPVLFLSALTDKAKVVNALELGADDYMEKPFNNNEFLARINVHVRIDHLKKNLLIEKEKSDKLLLNTLPKKIVDDLKLFGKTEPETFENVTVYFSDIVSFTNHSNGMKPDDLISELNEIFTEFDTIMERNHCERIKTIGDAYMAVCGMPEPDENHAENMMKAAIEIANYMKKRYADKKSNWEMRIGLNSGPVVGGIVGEKKYIYDVFGDTINTASRMESNSKPMQINVSPNTYHLLKDKFRFIERDAIEVKGKGKMKMYFVKTD